MCVETSALKDVKATVEFLKEKNFSNKEILQRPMSLLINKMTLINRLEVLEECCFREFQLMFLYRFVAVINRDITWLKAFNYIERSANVPQSIIQRLDVPVVLEKEISESTSLSAARETIMNLYLKQRLGMTNQELLKMWKIYSRLRHKSFESIVKVLDLLQNQLGFTPERIIKNGFLLYGCADNITQMMIDLPTISDVPIKDVLLRRPKIAMQNAESVRTIVQHVRKFDIPEDRILKCLEVLTLGPDTVYERLVQLTKVKEFNVLVSHPRILRLIHYQTKAATRLDYLKQLKVKCASLHVLSSSSDTFEKYARFGIDKTKGRDAVHYVSKVVNKDNEFVRSALSRQPNWCHVPLLTIKASIDFLRYKKFTMEEISENLVLLLYPVSRIEQKMKTLLEWKAETSSNNEMRISGVALSSISNSKLLNLCLYFIEAEFHFSGDGIWSSSERQDLKQDLFPTTIPEFPKSLTKVYRYGLQQKSDVQQSN